MAGRAALLAGLGIAIALLPPAAQAGQALCHANGCLVLLSGHDNGLACCYTPTTYQPAWGMGGYYSGVVSVTLSGGGYARTITCQGTLVGEIPFGSCTATGQIPPLGVERQLWASGVGSGELYAFVVGT